MEGCNRPSRSDVHLTREEEAKIEGETREYFDRLAPKRHSKPQRSEYSPLCVDDYSTNSNKTIPELVEFQRLEIDPHKLEYDGTKVTEEYVETEYYRDLNGVEKLHHTTGTGFIKLEDANNKGFSLEPKSTNNYHESCKGNPATNDWIPDADNMAFTVSDKPNRSEN